MNANATAIRIATVYRALPLTPGDAHAMDVIRWLRISEALASSGFRVDMIVGAGARLDSPHPNLRHVPLHEADWSAYHVVKTLYPHGFHQLVEAGGASHPFIISRLASVVGKEDLPGVHFVGAERAERYRILEAVARTSHCVAVSTEANRQLWRRQFGDRVPLLLVPTGVDRVIPSPGDDPYRVLGGAAKIAVYIGNLYVDAQRQVNLLWQQRLNRLGALLRARGLRLVFVGPGLTDRLDPSVVHVVGPVPHHAVWDYQYFADVGLVLAQGPVQHNESSKIYYYLRTGLPVVTEAPVPNSDVVTGSGCGFIVPYADDHALADAAEAAAHRRWDRAGAVAYVLAHHTWDRRVTVYHDLIHRRLGSGPAAGDG